MIHGAEQFEGRMMIRDQNKLDEAPLEESDIQGFPLLRRHSTNGPWLDLSKAVWPQHPSAP